MDKHESFVLERWLKAHHPESKFYGVYHEKSEDYDNGWTVWTSADHMKGYKAGYIDHPFCHELIKGLDAEMQVKYFDELVDIVCQLSEGVNNLNYKRGAYGPRPITLNSYILTKIHTASVPQILEAYYSALKGE